MKCIIYKGDTFKIREEEVFWGTKESAETIVKLVRSMKGLNECEWILRRKYMLIEEWKELVLRLSFKDDYRSDIEVIMQKGSVFVLWDDGCFISYKRFD